MKHSTARLSTVILTVFALICALLAIGVFVGFKIYSSGFEEVDATVTGTETIERRRNNPVTYTDVSYTYEGQTYEGRLDYSDSDLTTGSTVTVNIDPDDPTKLFYDGQYLLVWVFTGMAVFFLICALMCGVLARRKRKEVARQPHIRPPLFGS